MKASTVHYEHIKGPPTIPNKINIATENNVNSNTLPPRYIVPDWNFQVAQFQRFLQWQQYQQVLFDQRSKEQKTYCGVSAELNSNN